MAYKKAHEYQNEAFKNALTAWLGLGFYLGLLEIGLAVGDIAVKNWSYLWAVIRNLLDSIFRRLYLSNHFVPPQALH
ncbi:hypothetical protein [Thermococcus sp.]|uniref:hypothetical protein n=1 Tax=Thermococcus sp. TaxID=35749 RepID=UPI002625915F|nr:hypothetical protein [Thermococcus sp.]